jgi:asparagine synthase (glutamine-hydrolysing)
VPLAKWLRTDLAVFARDVLLSDRAANRGLLNRAAVEQLLRLNAGGRDYGVHLWTLLSLELWCRRFLDSRTLAEAA